MRAEILIECKETRELAPLIATVGDSNDEIRKICDNAGQERAQMERAQAKKMGALAKLKESLLRQCSVQQAARNKIREQVVSWSYI